MVDIDIRQFKLRLIDLYTPNIPSERSSKTCMDIHTLPVRLFIGPQFCH